MKKIVAITLLLSSVNMINSATWSEMFQEALTGKPAAVTTAPASNTSTTSGWADSLRGMLGDQPAVANAPTTSTANTSALAQIKDVIPSLIANIKLAAPALVNIATKSQEGFFSGLSAAFSTDSATKAALGSVISQIKTVVSNAQNIFNQADPATKATVRSLLTQVTDLPEFKTLFQYAKDAPFIGSALKSLTEEAAK